MEKDVENRKGLCVLCGQRVRTGDAYVESSEGYIHHACLSESSVLA